MSKEIIGKHPDKHPYGVSLSAHDTRSISGVPHRALAENENHDEFMDFTLEALKIHHVAPDDLERRKEIIRLFRIRGLDISTVSPYPTDPKMQRGNFAEIVLAEYLTAATSLELPVYKLRYNPNTQQSMKGDDVLLFDLDSDPVCIIVAESKFRGTPDKNVVTEIITGLIRSNKSKLPASLMFVAERLNGENKTELRDKVLNCAYLLANDKLDINYVGFLLSSHNASTHIDRNTTNDLRNLFMISLGVNAPEEMVQDAFQKLEADL